MAATATRRVRPAAQGARRSVQGAVPAGATWQAADLLAVPLAQGLHEFREAGADYLSFGAGAVLHVLEKGGEWWTCELDGKVGLVPSIASSCCDLCPPGKSRGMVCAGGRGGGVFGSAAVWRLVLVDGEGLCGNEE